jgi:hypothetical protein
MTTNDDMTDDDFDIVECLSTEEIETLTELNKKIYDAYNEYQKNKKYDHIKADAPIDFSDKHPEIIHKEHITDCPHEMRITMEAKVSSIDNKGYLQEVKDITVKHFHIPIPSNTNYDEIVNMFFIKMQEKIFDTCTEVIKPEFDKHVAKKDK